MSKKMITTNNESWWKRYWRKRRKYKKAKLLVENLRERCTPDEQALAAYERLGKKDKRKLVRKLAAELTRGRNHLNSHKVVAVASVLEQVGKRTKWEKKEYNIGIIDTLKTLEEELLVKAEERALKNGSGILDSALTAARIACLSALWECNLWKAEYWEELLRDDDPDVKGWVVDKLLSLSEKGGWMLLDENFKKVLPVVCGRNTPQSAEYLKEKMKDPEKREAVFDALRHAKEVPEYFAREVWKSLKESRAAVMLVKRVGVPEERIADVVDAAKEGKTRGDVVSLLAKLYMEKRIGNKEMMPVLGKALEDKKFNWYPVLEGDEKKVMIRLLSCMKKEGGWNAILRNVDFEEAMKYSVIKKELVLYAMESEDADIRGEVLGFVDRYGVLVNELADLIREEIGQENSELALWILLKYGQSIEGYEGGVLEAAENLGKEGIFGVTLILRSETEDKEMLERAGKIVRKMALGEEEEGKDGALSLLPILFPEGIYDQEIAGCLESLADDVESAKGYAARQALRGYYEIHEGTGEAADIVGDLIEKMEEELGYVDIKRQLNAVTCIFHLCNLGFPEALDKLDKIYEEMIEIALDSEETDNPEYMEHVGRFAAGVLAAMEPILPENKRDERFIRAVTLNGEIPEGKRVKLRFPGPEQEMPEENEEAVGMSKAEMLRMLQQMDPVAFSRIKKQVFSNGESGNAKA